MSFRFCQFLSFFLVPGICLAQDSPRKVRVFVSILPQVEFVERIGGDRVDVEPLVLPGQSPHTYNPTPKQIAGLSRADLYFRIGVPFEESLLPKIEGTIKHPQIVDTRRGIKLRRMDAGDHDHDHRAGGDDPHLWLNPLLVKKQCETIRDALIQIDPAGTAEYERNCAAFAEELDALHDRLQKALAPLKGREFFVFHPAYGYFADAFGLKQVAVEVEGKEPRAQQLSALIQKARQRGVKVIFVQPQFSPKSAEAVAAAINGVVVPLDPLARNYIRNLEDMAAKIEAALKK